MIDVQIDAKHYDLDDDLEARINEGFGGLDEYMDDLSGARVAVTWDGGVNERTSVHAQVWGPGHTFEGSDTDWKAVTAVESTRHKIETQIRREHGKEISQRDRRGR